ncbi:restriction endonuclease subunit S [Streptomyces sp. NPDC008139]|uniref:restriction endonuclease subunit S n=1 Tax=Streptomyces sp. NPDC008139 TaxID=3364814 RepID=UPI0036E034C5
MELPAGWEWATLGEVAQSVKNGMYVSRPGTVPDGVPILRISAVRPMHLRTDDLRYTGLSLDEVEAKDGIARPGDLLFTRYNGNINLVGACARVPDHAPVVAYPDKLIRVSVRDGIDSHFLCYVWSWADTQAQLRQHVKTTAGQAGISGSSLKNIRLPIAPLAEQHRIVEALEDHLSRLDQASANLEHANGWSLPLRRSLLWNLRQHALRSGATCLSLDSVADTSLGKMLDSKRNTGPETPYLRNINVRWGGFELADISTVPMPAEQSEKFSLRPGDLLVCEGGEPGRCAIWPGSKTPMTYQKALHRVRPTGTVSSRWLALMIEEAVRNGRTARMLTGTTIKHLPQEKLRRLEIPIPTRAVQDYLTDSYSNSELHMARLQTAAVTATHRSKHLRTALLNRAFAGRLVPQDPADEPASVLLDRIRAERETQGGKPKRTRRAVPKQAAVGPAPAAKANPIPTDAVQLEF